MATWRIARPFKPCMKTLRTSARSASERESVERGGMREWVEGLRLRV